METTQCLRFSETQSEFYLIFIKFKAISFTLGFFFQANDKDRGIRTTNPRNLCANYSLRRRPMQTAQVLGWAVLIRRGRSEVGLGRSGGPQFH